jgi:hypothetical protein
MDRIAQAFQIGIANARPDAAAACPVRAPAPAKRPPDSGGPLPAWIGMKRDGREPGDRAPSDFSHLHRSLAAGEPIPKAPGLIEQIRGLSRLLARHPLSRQEEEALRGEDEPEQTGVAPQVDTADAEDEAFA